MRNFLNILMRIRIIIKPPVPKIDKIYIGPTTNKFVVRGLDGTKYEYNLSTEWGK